MRFIQFGSQIPPAEIVGVGDPRGAQRLELLPALLDQLVVFFHFYTPCFRLAVMKSSRSPSSTAWVLPTSTPVRRSLMRDWSSTYERIWWPQPMSVLESSSACFWSSCLRISSSYSFDFSIAIASARFLCCERSFWHCTTILV